MNIRSTAVAIVCLLGPLAAYAQDGARPNLTIGRADQPPVIDGVVDDVVWNSAQPFSTFIQQEPNEGEPASERTEIRFLLDRQNLYVALVCFDREPQDILVSQSRRDADLGDTDSVRVLLDTFNDGQNAFVFGTNPFGIEYDGQVMAEGHACRSPESCMAWRSRRVVISSSSRRMWPVR